MSNSELVRPDPNLPSAPDNLPSVQSGSELPRRSHILVLGNIMSGAGELFHILKEEATARSLRPEDAVEYSRNGRGVTDAFYGVTDWQTRRNHAAASTEEESVVPELPAAASAPAEEGARRGLLRRIANLGKRSVVSSGVTPVIPEQPEEVLPAIEDRPKSLPLGVLAFNEMRDYSGLANGDMPTPFDELEALAERHGIPVVRVEKIDPDSMRAAIGGLLTPRPELPPAQEP